MIDLYVLGLLFILLLVCIWQQVEISELKEDRTRLGRHIDELKRLYRLRVSEEDEE